MVVKDGANWHLRNQSRSVPLPPGSNELIAWVIARERFSGDEIAAAFPDTGAEERGRLLRDLAAMKVIEPN